MIFCNTHKFERRLSKSHIFHKLLSRINDVDITVYPVHVSLSSRIQQNRVIVSRFIVLQMSRNMCTQRHMCTQRRFKSTCTLAQTDQNIHWRMFIATDDSVFHADTDQRARKRTFSHVNAQMVNL